MTMQFVWNQEPLQSIVDLTNISHNIRMKLNGKLESCCMLVYLSTVQAHLHPQNCMCKRRMAHSAFVWITEGLMLLP
jgi:hypothetical protein